MHVALGQRLLGATLFAVLAVAAAASGAETDPGYRVQIVAAPDQPRRGEFPPPSKDWELAYQFLVPPLPTANWSPDSQTFYLWGDVDFDLYGSNGRYVISDYVYNQIVPELMIGRVLAHNDSGYGPIFITADHWVFEAQYFWLKQDGTAYAQTGKMIRADPGETLTTRIRYHAASGQIDAAIASSRGISKITIVRPFPNKDPQLFSSWRDFFRKAVEQSQTLIGAPQVNVESHYVDQATLCSVLPFVVDRIRMPFIPAEGSAYQVYQIGSYTCPTALAELNF